jgi:hypothetical protein
VVAKDFVEPVRDVLKANGVSFVCYGNMFDNYYGVASLLEGMVTYLTLQAARRSLVISYIRGYKSVQNASEGRGEGRNPSIGFDPPPVQCGIFTILRFRSPLT